MSGESRIQPTSGTYTPHSSSYTKLITQQQWSHGVSLLVHRAYGWIWPSLGTTYWPHITVMFRYILLPGVPFVKMLFEENLRKTVPNSTCLSFVNARCLTKNIYVMGLNPA